VVQVLAPVGSGRPVAALAVRLSAASASSPAWTVMGAHAVFSAGIIVLFGFVLFRRSLLLPIARMRDGTRRIASGEFGVSVSEDAPGEIADLASSLNAMSTALAEFRVRTADQLARLELANAELRRTQDALVRSEKLASVGRLAAGLAHELGNPLTAVRGYLEILALDPPPGGEEVLRRCGVEAERMHQLLRNLLDFARNGEAEIGDVDVGELLAEAADTVRHQAAFRPVRVEVDAGQGLVVRGEVTKLHQVLVNLLLNAADAGARSIQLLARRDGADVVLACADDGSGIAPEHLPRLFEPFFTTRPPGKGTGLGLAIAHRVVEQHGGRIEARSEPGAGATFTLRLPATPEPAEAGSAPPGPAAADVPSSVVPSAPAGERRAPPAGIDVR
jgi:signal transduction histidine kinase